jgi:hypothetical protein
MTVQAFRTALTLYIINPIIAILFLVAVIVFIWGLVRFLGYLGSDSSEKEKGKKHMIMGVLGIFIMAAALSIINVVVGTIGVQPVDTLTAPTTLGQ